LDLGTIIGIAVALFGILVGQAIEGGSVLQILQPTAALIVFGGTLGATMIGFPMSVLKQAAADIVHIFKEGDAAPEGIIDDVIRLANKARESFPWKRTRNR
jgi:chemotaxis protein MotA